MDKVFNLKIDSKVRNINIVQGLKQFENNSILNITLLQNSLALDLTNCTVRLNFLREDKRVFLYMADIVKADEGKVSIKLSPEVLEKPGNIKVDISVFDSNLLKITSVAFNMKVDKSIYSNDYYLNMKDFDIVQRMHIEEEKRIVNENKRIQSESTRITDEKKRSDTESLRTEKENERISNEEKRVQSESKRNKDEQIRSESENKRKEYEKNRLDQEEIRVKNEKLRIETENQRKIYEDTRADNELGRITYEAKRTTNEKIRIESELTRVKNEKLRNEGEDKRSEAEKLRVEKEAERINQEGKRNTAENTRVHNETNRVEAEKTRVQEWNKIKDIFNDKAPGDMKTVVYDKNSNGKVDIAEIAESVEWKNVKGRPNLDNIIQEVTSLKTHVDNKKDSLYSVAIDKKSKPRSKDFNDIIQAFKDVKLGQGNAQPYQVLKNATFTNDSGELQTGIMPNMGLKEFTPKTYSQELGFGFYYGIKIIGINELDESSCEDIVNAIRDRFPNIIKGR